MATTDHHHDKSGLCVRVRDNVYVIADEAWNDPTVLSDADRASLAEHIEECPPCLKMVERASTEADLLRLSVKRHFSCDEVTVSALMKLVRTAPCGESDGGTEHPVAQVRLEWQEPRRPGDVPAADSNSHVGPGGSLRWIMVAGLAASIALIALVILPELQQQQQDGDGAEPGNGSGAVAAGDTSGQTDGDAPIAGAGNDDDSARKGLAAGAFEMAKDSSPEAMPVAFDFAVGLEEGLRTNIMPLLPQSASLTLPDLSHSAEFPMYLTRANAGCDVGSRRCMLFHYTCPDDPAWCQLHVTSLKESESMHSLLGMDASTLMDPDETMEFWHVHDGDYDIVAWDEQAVGYMLVTHRGAMPGEMDAASFAMHVRKSDMVVLAN